MKAEQHTPVAPRGPALVVAGMHRSGTSAMARVLSLAGGTLPERVIQPGPDNPLGFWEPWEMVALSDEILADVGSSWDDLFVHAADAPAWERRDAFLPRAEAFVTHNFGGRPMPVIKDPRASVLTRLWRQALVNGGYRPAYVVMVRHPLEVAGSLAARDGFPTVKSLLVWSAYMLAVERDTRADARLFVAYPDLIADWRSVLDRIERVIGAALPGRTDLSAMETDRFLSRSHRHHESSDAQLSALGILPVIETIHRWMQAAAAGGSPDPAVMDEAGRSLGQLMETMRPVHQDQVRRSLERERSIASELADAEARLVRARAHAREIELGSAEREAVAASEARELRTAWETQSGLAEAGATEVDRLTAELRSANLALSSVQTTLAETRVAFHTHQEEARKHLADGQAREAEGRAREAEGRAREAEGHERLAEAEQRATLLKAELEATQRQARDARDARDALQGQIDGLTARIETIKRSAAWKFARPVRVIEGRLKRARLPGG